MYDKHYKLRADKFPSVDGMYQVAAKNFANVIFEPLSHIFSQSLLCNIVPHDWKLANVTPQFNKGLKIMGSSYRPVSFTSQVCKSMESISKDSNLDQNVLIKDPQHGFRAGRSCLTNLLHFMEIVTKQVYKALPVDVVYLDSSKAFDKVRHNDTFNWMLCC